VPNVADRPRVLVLGASGLLGSHLVERLPASFRTVATRGRSGRLGMDARVEWLPQSFEAADARSVEQVLDAARADVIVNAVGAKPPIDADTMEGVNARFPRALAAMADARGSRVIHVSTDGVFSGARGGYSERDVADPADAYGRAKLAGELAAPHLTIRTSFFGRTSRNEGVIEWLVAQRGRTIEGFADYRFSGISAARLADALAEAIGAADVLEGLYHVGGEPITKYELLKAAAERLQIDVRVIPVERGAVDRTLDSSRFFAAIHRRPPVLADSLESLVPCSSPLRN
jgi:dTDP-4-dehydrorhamnose reductase